MKVALISPYMPPHTGGIERIAHSLFQGYRRRGIEVLWIASRAPATATRREEGRIRVRCLNAVEDALGVPVPLWGADGWRELNAAAAWADAVHVIECLYLSSAMSALAARRHGKPVLLSQNVGFIQYRSAALNLLQRAAYRTVGRWVLAHADHVVLASAGAETFIPTAARLQEEQISRVPVGIDTTRFRPSSPAERRAARATLGLPDAPPIVFFAGRLVEKKGLPLVLEAAASIPLATFVVVGDGPLRSLLPSAPANVTWRPAVDPAVMPLYYQAADCVLLPSHGEGLPLVVQEALAAGLPCVISADEAFAGALLAAGACVGVARTGPAIAGAVGELLGGGTAPLRGRARAYAEEFWDVESMVERHLALLTRICASSRRAVVANAPGGERAG